MNLTSRYDGLVFDCDGTLADTMPAHYVAWCATMNRYGITFPEDRFYSLGGVPTRKIIHMLATEAGVVLDCDAVAKEKEEAFHQSLHAVGPIDVVVAIAEAHRGRLPMAVAEWLAARLEPKSILPGVSGQDAGLEVEKLRQRDGGVRSA